MSAVIVDASTPLVPENNEILSDEQIEQLLQDAETRLRNKAGLDLKERDSDDVLTLDRTHNPSQTRIHKLNLQHGVGKSAYIKNQNGVAKADPKLLVTADQRKMADELRPVAGQEKRKSTRMNDQTTSGPQWFDLPKTELTPQLKRDLQLIEMRSVLDPHRHYKKNTRKGKVPAFSQTGTVIEGPAEWYSSRINNKDRAKNFVDEAMKTEQQTGRFKRKYGEIQDAKTSGKRAHYQKLMEQRKKKKR